MSRILTESGWKLIKENAEVVDAFGEKVTSKARLRAHAEAAAIHPNHDGIWTSLEHPSTGKGAVFVRHKNHPLHGNDTHSYDLEDDGSLKKGKNGRVKKPLVIGHEEDEVGDVEIGRRR